MSEVKDIKDYLHLYLGCEVLVQGEERKGYLTGVTNGGYECEIQYQLVDNPHHLEEEPEFSSWEDVRPLLRPLSDITEEEAIEITKIITPHSGTSPKIYKVNKSNDCFEVDVFDDFSNIKSSNPKVSLWASFSMGNLTCSCGNKQKAANANFELSRYLLSKSFDLFGLIESGLAIDKTKQLTNKSENHE